MPLPLKPGYHFHLDRTTRPAYYEMSAAEAYTDFYGISYMVSGDRLIYSPEFTTIAKAGDIVFIPKNVYRRTTYISHAPYERILIKFTDFMIEDLIALIGQKTYDDLCKEHVIHLNAEIKENIYALLSEMEQEWNCYGKYSELLLKGLLHKLIITCLKEQKIIRSGHLGSEQKHTYLPEAIQYIKTHLRESPSLAQTASAINISSSYLSKLFVQHLHTPYSTFVLNEKITYAQKLLVETKLSMTEIAAEAGFTSNAYFSDCFKRIAGLSPLKFRQKNQ